MSTGYIRVWNPRKKKLQMLHQIVWEQANGNLPAGYQIHHKNHVRTDNRISNLQLVTPLEHKRIHRGGELRGGIWWLPCSGCKLMKAEGEYYTQGKWKASECKNCHLERTTNDRRKRKQNENIHR